MRTASRRTGARAGTRGEASLVITSHFNALESLCACDGRTRSRALSASHRLDSGPAPSASWVSNKDAL